jgi:hypothetical protein
VRYVSTFATRAARQPNKGAQRSPVFADSTSGSGFHNHPDACPVRTTQRKHELFDGPAVGSALGIRTMLISGITPIVVAVLNGVQIGSRYWDNAALPSKRSSQPLLGVHLGCVWTTTTTACLLSSFSPLLSTHFVQSTRHPNLRIVVSLLLLSRLLSSSSSSTLVVMAHILSAVQGESNKSASRFR